ncbi:cation transporter [Streptomyces sp. NPDC060048]|uniref:cation transporter n=1 Tax=unclassified Streptomyces TaxID=2593676 RepID=UPI0036A49D72
MRHPRDVEPSDVGKERSTAVLDVRGMVRATQQNTVVAVLGRRPGVLDVEVNPVAQSATVVFDPRRTSLAELRGWVTECGYHCAGQSVPAHICDPMDEPDPPGPATAEAVSPAHGKFPSPHTTSEPNTHRDKTSQQSTTS